MNRSFLGIISKGSKNGFVSLNTCYTLIQRVDFVDGFFGYFAAMLFCFESFYQFLSCFWIIICLSHHELLTGIGKSEYNF